MLLQPRLLVFDLDGTLIDSRKDLTNSVNAMLAHFGKPALDEPIVSSYIGDGATTLVRRALSHSLQSASLSAAHHEAQVSEGLDYFLHYYRLHKLDHTYVYPGVFESLTAIRQRHQALPMAVLTNKPVRPSRQICQHLGLDPFFFAIEGGDSFATKKPDPAGLLKIIAEAAVLPEDTVMVGDSHIDVETARACGARSLGCTYGLSPKSLVESRPDLIVHDAQAWPATLNL